MTRDPSKIVEIQDQLDILRDHGFDVLIEALLDPASYTRKGNGRINFSAVARNLGHDRETIIAQLASARLLLQK